MTFTPTDDSLTNSACITDCPDRWCCSDCNFCAPPLCRSEVQRIRDAGHRDFYMQAGDQFSLSTRENGYCIFFDDTRKICNIYDIRPFDCRIFPFDMLTPRADEGYWILWDCAFSRQLDPGIIEATLSGFESVYAGEIIETWSFDSEISHPEKYRILRKMRVTPPHSPRP